MRIAIFAGLCVLLGCLTGFGLTWSEFSRLNDQFGLAAAHDVPANEEVPRSGPRAVVEGGTEFDFGSLAPQQSGLHRFVIRNTGDETLELSLQSVTCGMCIQTDFESASLQPGESVDIALTYATKKAGPKFFEHAEIATNDPAYGAISLKIRGFITHAVRSSVEELNLGDISANESKTVELRLHGFLSKHLELLKAEVPNPEVAEAFEIQYRPLTAEEVAEEEKALVGYAVEIAVKPGLPLGPINQTIHFEFQADEPVSLDVPIRGTVVSDITFVGSRRLIGNANLLYLGTVEREQGKELTLRVLVKGPYRDNVQLKVVETDPEDVLRARVGELQKIAGGTLHMYPLTVEIVKNARAVNRLGTEQGEAGRIVLETNHPIAKKVTLSVRFATE